MTGQFTADQVERMLRPIRPGRVYTSQGQSNVAAWDIRAHLTRMFGFGGWSKKILALELVQETPVETLKDGKTRVGWYVTYRCTLRLSVRDPHGELVMETEDGATGSAQNQPSLGDAHDLALKNSISYALKRCAIDLGDQFGLSLYNGGSTNAVVGVTLVGMPDGSAAQEPTHVVTEEAEPAESYTAEQMEPM